MTLILFLKMSSELLYVVEARLRNTNIVGNIKTFVTVFIINFKINTLLKTRFIVCYKFLREVLKPNTQFEPLNKLKSYDFISVILI